MKRSIALVVACFAVLGVATSGAAESPLLVVDSIGSVVGPVVGFHHGNTPVFASWPAAPVVLFREGNHNILLTVDTGALWTGRDVYFSGSNCTGTVAIQYDELDVSAARLQRWVYGTAPGNLIYGASIEDPTGFPTAASWARNGSTCQNSTPSSFSPGKARVAQPIVDLDDLFTPPFRMVRNEAFRCPTIFRDGFEKGSTSAWGAVST